MSVNPIPKVGKPAKLMDSVRVCVLLESIAPSFGCHIALTGGTLYKPGERKDMDILFYRIRQVREIDMEGLSNAMVELGFTKPSGFGWCYKTQFNGYNIDMFFPEEQGGEYVG